MEKNGKNVPYMQLKNYKRENENVAQANAHRENG